MQQAQGARLRRAANKALETDQKSPLRGLPGRSAWSLCAEAIRLEENRANLYGAARNRVDIALLLANAGHLQDAREYARTALGNFESYGETAADAIQETRQLIEQIEGAT